MRHLLAGTAAAVIAFAATPAFAQYGGAPQDQVEDAPADPDSQQAVPDDEDAGQAEDQSALAPDEGAAEEVFAGKPGVDEAGLVDESAEADGDADVDVDVDQGNAEADVDADVNADVDQDVDADSEDMAPGDVDSDQGYED